jgi:hypothetical protein
LRAQADSFDALAAMYSDVAANPGTATAAAGAPPAKPVSADELKNAAMKVMQKHGRDKVREIMTAVCGKDTPVKDVPEDKRPAALAALEKAEAAAVVSAGDDL